MTARINAKLAEGLARLDTSIRRVDRVATWPRRVLQAAAFPTDTVAARLIGRAARGANAVGSVGWYTPQVAYLLVGSGAGPAVACPAMRYGVAGSLDALMSSRHERLRQRDAASPLALGTLLALSLACRAALWLPRVAVRVALVVGFGVGALTGAVAFVLAQLFDEALTAARRPGPRRRPSRPTAEITMQEIR